MMRVGLIAMSGVRAADEELTRFGLELPGFAERAAVIASMPSLSLLTVAAATPPDVEVEYHEVRDGPPVEPPGRFDLVAISSYTAQIRDAYRLADRYRARGVPVVIGGLHATVLPEEAQAHCTAVAVGEGELLWPCIVADFRAGRLKPVYRAPPGARLRLRDAPIPRYELLDPARYNRLTVQTSRGCPWQCDFCAGSILLGPGYRTKPPERVVAEIRRIKSIWPAPFLELADDNSFVSRRHARALLAALAAEGVRWFTEADVSIADDPELLELMRAAGCRQVLVGLETPTAAALDGLELKRNFKLRRLPRYEAAVRSIQAHGITVNGCFILGLDGDTEDVFESVYRFVERTGLYDVQLTVPTPFPGTPLYERLRAQGRLLEERAWEKCTLFDVNFRPAHMSPQRLREGLRDLCRRIYDPEFVRHRRRRYLREARRAAGPRAQEVPRDATLD